MSRAHALLSPSGAARWLACTPSARLEDRFEDKSSEAAEEGTTAHALGELLLRENQKELTGVKLKRQLAKLQKSKYYDSAMQEYAEDYRDFVLERYADALATTKDALLEIEVKLDLTDYVPEGFGTGDAVIIADGTLDLIDMKYGKGVKVDANENKQMMLYGLGALAKYDFIYAISKVRMTIFQPRLDNFSTYELSVKDLKEWGEKELKPKAKKAFAGEGKYNPGPHCQFCKAKAVCKANAEYRLQLAKYEFNEADLLKDEEVTNILDQAKEFKSWLRAVEEYAKDQAVSHGKKWPGYKLVAGRSNRIITNEEEAEKILRAQGLKEEDIFKIKLQGITHLEKLLGKKEFKEHLGKIVDKPEGKPTLVPDYDKRPELNSTEEAVKDFEDK